MNKTSRKRTDQATRRYSERKKRGRTNGTITLPRLKGKHSAAQSMPYASDEQRYRTLFDLVPVAVYVCDADGVITEFNRRAAELWVALPDNAIRNRSIPESAIWRQFAQFPTKFGPMNRFIGGGHQG